MLPIQLFQGIAYPELALLMTFCYFSQWDSMPMSSVAWYFQIS